MDICPSSKITLAPNLDEKKKKLKWILISLYQQCNK